jgi:capping protein alpha
MGRKSTLKSLSTYVKEHYPNAAFGVYPIESDSKVAAVVVANKYSPNNFWYSSKMTIRHAHRS